MQELQLHVEVALQQALEAAAMAKRNLDDAIEAGLPEAQRQIQANIDSFKFVTSDLSCANIASGILDLPIEFSYPDAAASANNNYTG